MPDVLLQTCPAYPAVCVGAGQKTEQKSGEEDGRYERQRVGGEEVAAFVPHRCHRALRLFELLPRHPVLSANETTGKRRDRSYVYQAYVERLRLGTDLPGTRSTP